MSVVVTIAIVLVVAWWGMAIYNRLVRLRNRVASDWRRVDVQLKRRHDLIPSLVAAVKGAMAFERDTLGAVVAARQRAMAAPGPKAAAEREADLSASLARVITTVVERYPDLTVSQNVRSLQADLSAIEDSIASARAAYNDTATAYNTAIGVVPDTFVAGMAGFARAELFTVAAAERGTARVSLQ
jgi:LemA protein